MNNKFDLSNRIYYLIAIVGLALALLSILGAYSYYKSASGSYPREINVSAQGKAYAKPDIASVTVGLTGEGVSATALVKENNDKMNKIIKEIKTLGIEEKDIKTTNYNLSPKYNWTNKKGSFIDGYTMDQNIQIKIRDFDKIGDVLSKSAELGANVVNDVSFEIDNPETVRAEAMKEAVAKAKEKARNIAKASGLKLGKLINVYEDTYSSSSPTYQTKESLGMGGGDTTPAPDIQPGEQEVTVTMNLTYRVR